MAILDAYKNLALAQVLTAPSPPTSGTSLTLAAGQGAWLPAPPFNATIFAAASFPTPANAEIIRVTALAGDVATIVRQQEGSAARAILAGDFVAGTFTTKFVTDITDSSNQAAGTLPDARLSSNIPRLDASNTFTGGRQQLGPVAVPILAFHDSAPPADARVFRIMDGGQMLRFEALNDAQSAVAGTPLVLTRAGDAQVGQNLYEKGRTTPLGHWQDIAFNAANFAATGGTWTVTAHDRFSYTLVGKTVSLQLFVSASTVGGTPSFLYIFMPFTLLAGQTGLYGYNTNGVWGTGLYVQPAADSALRLYRDPFSSAFGAGSFTAYLALTLQIA